MPDLHQAAREAADLTEQAVSMVRGGASSVGDTVLALGLTWVAAAPWAEHTKARRVSGGPHAMRRAGVATAGRSSVTASP